MSASRSSIAKFIIIASLALTVVSSSGCIGFTSHLLYWIHGGHKIAPEFDGLEDKRVAVVCVSNSTSYGPNSVSGMLQRFVATILSQKGDDIEVVPQEEVADWIDNNDWDQMDYREIGRGVDAEMVLAIDLDGFRLHEGRTLYRGRTDVVLTVYDMREDGKVVFRKNIPEFSFPRNGARHATELSEASFRRLFVLVLSQHVAKYFHAYHIEDDFATDAMSLSS
jgi:hypothetical protein